MLLIANCVSFFDITVMLQNIFTEYRSAFYLKICSATPGTSSWLALNNPAAPSLVVEASNLSAITVTCASGICSWIRRAAESPIAPAPTTATRYFIPIWNRWCSASDSRSFFYRTGGGGDMTTSPKSTTGHVEWQRNDEIYISVNRVLHELDEVGIRGLKLEKKQRSQTL